MAEDYETIFDDHCDFCKHLERNKCGDLDYCKENFSPFECCEDNLKKNVGEIAFKYDVPQNFAVAIIKIIEKERERNESMYVHREYIEDWGDNADTEHIVP